MIGVFCPARASSSSSSRPPPSSSPREPAGHCPRQGSTSGPTAEKQGTDEVLRRLAKLELENFELKKTVTNQRKDINNLKQPPQQHSPSSSSHSSSRDRDAFPDRQDFRNAPTEAKTSSHRHIVYKEDHRPASWEEETRHVSPADDDETWSLDPPPKRSAHRGGASGSGRKSRP